VGAAGQIADYARAGRAFYDNPEGKLREIAQAGDEALSNIGETFDLVSEDPGVLIDAADELVTQSRAAAGEAAALAVTDRDAFQQGLGRGGVKYVAGTVVRRGVAKAGAVVKKGAGAAVKKVLPKRRNVSRSFSSRKKLVSSKPKPTPHKPMAKGKGATRRKPPTRQRRNRKGEGTKLKTDHGTQPAHGHDRFHNDKTKDNAHYKTDG
jgi:hypothetical protein